MKNGGVENIILLPGFSHIYFFVAAIIVYMQFFQLKISVNIMLRQFELLSDILHSMIYCRFSIVNIKVASKFLLYNTKLL